MTNTLMIKIKPYFQKELFEKLIRKYGSSFRVGEILNLPASSVRGYKNLYFNSIPKPILDSIKKLNLLSPSDLEKNTLSTFFKEDQINQSLFNGRKIRNNKLIALKNSLPKLSKIIEKNSINFERWFQGYFPLMNVGFRRTNFTLDKGIVRIGYNNFTKEGFKRFNVEIPRKFSLDDEFIYFFGLWCGDRAGGKRFGVCNQDKGIIQFTESFLKKNKQKTERILYYSELIKEPSINYDKKFVLKTDKKGWVLSVHAGNGILVSFFEYLKKNLDEFLNLVNIKPFFAGLFDAEGNISMYNKSFRIACKDKELIEIYKKYLGQLELYDKYDGCCLITYNTDLFGNLILPYMKHSQKIIKSNFLLTGDEPIPAEYESILTLIKLNPGKTEKELSKALNKNKLYSELKLLSDFNLISHEGYPYRYKINH